MSLTAFDLPAIFGAAVELAEATAAVPEDFAKTEPLDLDSNQNPRAEWLHWHDALDSIVGAALRLKVAQGAVTETPILGQTLVRTWPAFHERFQTAKHSAPVRRALWKVANAAVDLSGYAAARQPDQLLRERGLRLLRQGLAQVWDGLANAERQAVETQLRTASKALGWPANPKKNPPPYDGPADMDPADEYRVLNLSGYYSQTKQHLPELLKRVEEMNKLIPAGKTPLLDAVDEEDILILKAMKDQAPRLLTVAQIQGFSNVSKKTIGPRLNDLIEKKRACRPKGPKMGATITPVGISLLEKCVASK
jgi:hypothetical protein